MTTALSLDALLGCFSSPTTTVRIGHSSLGARLVRWAAEPGRDELVTVSVDVDEEVVDLTPAEAAALVPALRAFTDQLARIAADATEGAVTIAAPSAQQIFDRACQLGIAGTISRITEALLSPRPVESLEWLASTETDPHARFGFTTAAELVRAREGGSRD